MNFDLSALDRLQEKKAATRSTKFAPTSKASLVRVATLGSQILTTKLVEGCQTLSERSPFCCSEAPQREKVDRERAITLPTKVQRHLCQLLQDCVVCHNQACSLCHVVLRSSPISPYRQPACIMCRGESLRSPGCREAAGRSRECPCCQQGCSSTQCLPWVASGRTAQQCTRQQGN